MGEFIFGVGGGKIKASVAKRVDRIARKHGATFVSVNMPEGPRYCFAGPNLGSPFDQAMRDAVYEDLAKAGLRDENGLVRR